VTEDRELREILRATAQNAALPTVMPEPMRRKVTLRRARTIGLTFLTTVAIAVGGLQGIRALTFDEAAPTQPARQPGVVDPKVEDLTDRNIRDMTPDAPAPQVPYVIDLNTRDMTPLPESITQSLATGTLRGSGRLAVSPDGSSIAFVGQGGDGTPQIFIAGPAGVVDVGGRRRDGTGVRQVTHDPIGATWPAWSPDGTKIAYVGRKNNRSFDGNLFVLDVATGDSTQVADEIGWGPQFTTDGSSLLYTHTSFDAGVEAAELRIVPVTGGKGMPLFDLQARGFGYAGEGSLSPDGSLVTFMGHRIGGPGAIRFVANADGTDWRIVGSCISDPAGTWSPDGSRIVCGPNGPPPGIHVIDVATGDATRVADGRVAIWLDDHTLLVDV
jgi:Tol biopolymer transport system component